MHILYVKELKHTIKWYPPQKYLQKWKQGAFIEMKLTDAVDMNKFEGWKLSVSLSHTHNETVNEYFSSFFSATWTLLHPFYDCTHAVQECIYDMHSFSPFSCQFKCCSTNHHMCISQLYLHIVFPQLELSKDCQECSHSTLQYVFERVHLYEGAVFVT